jgi:hypothetical protein
VGFDGFELAGRRGERDSRAFVRRLDFDPPEIAFDDA